MLLQSVFAGFTLSSEPRKVPGLQSGMKCPAPQHPGIESSTEALPSSLSRADAVLSLDSQVDGSQPQDGHFLENSGSPKEQSNLHMDSSSRITPKGNQPQPKQDSTQRTTDGKSTTTGFVLSPDAPPYLPQFPLKTHLQVPQSLRIADPSGLGFIQPFQPPVGLQQAQGPQSHACDAPTEFGLAAQATPLEVEAIHQSDLPAVSRLEANGHLASAFGGNKASGNFSSLTANSGLPLKFCKFLIGEDVAGFLVGRKGVGG